MAGRKKWNVEGCFEELTGRTSGEAPQDASRRGFLSLEALDVRRARTTRGSGVFSLGKRKEKERNSGCLLFRRENRKADDPGIVRTTNAELRRRRRRRVFAPQSDGA